MADRATSTGTGMDASAGARPNRPSRQDDVAADAAESGPLRLEVDGRLYNPEDFSPAGPNRDAGPAALLLASIEREGMAATMARANGDLAVALRDNRDGSLTLARDRFGVRPLYHTVPAPGAAPAYGRRPEDLVGQGGASALLRRDHVASLAAANYRFFDIDPTRTAFRDVAQVPPGTVVSLRHGRVDRTEYAAFEQRDPHSSNARDLEAAYLALLTDAVERRLAGAERPGFSLSGGLDSSTVAALAARHAAAPVAAYSSVHGGGAYDETAEIGDVIDAGLATWSPVPIHAADVTDLLPALIGIHGEPVPTVTWLNHHLLCRRIAGDGHTAVLGGLGGDEQHAGEYDYFFYFFADLMAAGRQDDLAREIAAWQHHHDHPVHRKSPAIADEVIGRLTDPGHPGRCLPNRRALLRYADSLSPDFFDLASLDFAYETRFDSYLNAHSVNELLRNTMPCCLRASERNARHFGLADIHPFLDHRLVEFMLAIPSHMKIRDGVTKWFARQAYRGLLPEPTRTRIVKTGWNAPAHRWFAEDLREFLLDTLGAKRARERGLYDTGRLLAYADEHREIVAGGAPRENHMMLLWQALNLELWLLHLEQRTGTAASFG